MIDFANAPDMYPSQSCRIRMYSNFLSFNDLFRKNTFLFYVYCCLGAAEVPPRLPVQSSYGEVPLQSLASQCLRGERLKRESQDSQANL
jgi:hypothetical protein